MTKQLAKSGNVPFSDGPAMSLLSEREKMFVNLLFSGAPGTGYGRMSNAARIAGFGQGSTPQVLASLAQRLVNTDKIQAAIMEVTRKQIRSLGPQAVNTIASVMEHGAKDSDKLKAASMALDRVDPVINKSEVKVEVTDHTKEAVEYLAHLIRQGATEQLLINEFGHQGLRRYRALLEEREKATVIDADYEVVEPDVFDEIDRSDP